MCDRRCCNEIRSHEPGLVLPKAHDQPRRCRKTARAFRQCVRRCSVSNDQLNESPFIARVATRVATPPAPGSFRAKHGHTVGLGTTSTEDFLSPSAIRGNSVAHRPLDRSLTSARKRVLSIDQMLSARKQLVSIDSRLLRTRSHMRAPLLKARRLQAFLSNCGG